jgi:hypothetical protein
MAEIGTAYVTVKPVLDMSELSIPNPISDRARGWLYVYGGIVAGPVLAVVSAVLVILGLGVWAGVTGIVAAGLLTVSGTLARANLTVSPALATIGAVENVPAPGVELVSEA